MSQTDDFVIQDAVLLKYRGPGGTVVVPEGVRGILPNAFQESDIEEVILPEGLVWLGDYALSECPRLRRLVLPGTLRVVPDSLCWSSQALEEVVIPEGVVFLGFAALSETGLRRVTLPDSVHTIGASCFDNCKALESVTLGRGVRSLNFRAFQDCGNLRSISLPDSLRTIRSQAFCDCSHLESVRMGQNLESADTSLFMGCSLLREVEFPDALGSVWTNPSEPCFFVERVTFRGNRVKFLGPRFPRKPPEPEPPLAPIIRAPRLLPEWLPAASRPAALAGYEEMKEEGWPLAPEIAEAWEAFATGADPDSRKKPGEPFSIVDGVLCAAACTEGRVVVPDGVVGIRAEVFQRTEVRELWLPDSVQWIHEEAFMGCSQLEAVRLPAGLTRVPDNLFHGCRNLRSIRLPDSVTDIGIGAFAESGLETVALPRSLKVIESAAFLDCNRLRHVRFPEGLEEIRSHAFSRCPALTEAALPDSLLLLEAEAFSGCAALERVSMGAELRVLETDVFLHCHSLKEAAFSADLCSIRYDCFAACSDGLRLRLECSFAELPIEAEGLPSRVVAPNADPTILDEGNLRALLRGFASEDGKGFRYEAKYLDLLQAHKRELWDSEDVLRFLLRHNLLEREEIPDCLDALQAKKLPALVAEVLEYSHRRFPEPAPLLLE